MLLHTSSQRNLEVLPNMKKFFLLTIIFLTSVFAISAVYALDLGQDLVKDAGIKSGYDSNTSETSFAETLGSIVLVALSLVGIIFLSLMVYAGYLWLTSRGEDSRIEKAQDIIRASIIGLVITLGAYSITAFVLPRILEKTSGPATEVPPLPPGK